SSSGSRSRTAWARRPPARRRVAGGNVGANQMAALSWDSFSLTVGSPAMLIAARHSAGRRSNSSAAPGNARWARTRWIKSTAARNSGLPYTRWDCITRPNLLSVDSRVVLLVAGHSAKSGDERVTAHLIHGCRDEMAGCFGTVRGQRHRKVDV